MEYIYRVAAWELFGVRAPEGPLPMKAIRNTDFKEVLLEVKTLAYFSSMLCWIQPRALRSMRLTLKKALYLSSLN